MFVRNMVHALVPTNARPSSGVPRPTVPRPRRMTRSAGDPSDLHGMRRGIDVAWPTVRDTATATLGPVATARDSGP